MLRISVDRAATVQIIAITGQTIQEAISLSPNAIHQFSVSHLAAGVYVFRFMVEGKSISRRVVVR
jgi:hypothetical protein